MFDLEIIENDWKVNSFKLSENQIIEIYQSEGATFNRYFNDIKEYNENTHVKMTAEERLLAAIFGEDQKIKIEEQSLREKYEEPKKIRLSEKNQKRVVEGCLDVVFDDTKYWYDYFDGNIEMEKIYDICLDSLINSVKYCLHNEKQTFRNFISKSIERNIIKYIAKIEHISYRDAWCIINNNGFRFTDDFIFEKPERLKFNFDYDREIVQKPSKIYSYLRKEKYDIDYIKNVSSNEFMQEYNDILGSFDDLTISVMRLIFDSEGNLGLTCKEISDYLGLTSNKISTIKKKTLKKLSTDERIIKYRL